MYLKGDEGKRLQGQRMEESELLSASKVPSWLLEQAVISPINAVRIDVSAYISISTTLLDHPSRMNTYVAINSLRCLVAGRALWQRRGLRNLRRRWCGICQYSQVSMLLANYSQPLWHMAVCEDGIQGQAFLSLREVRCKAYAGKLLHPGSSYV